MQTNSKPFSRPFCSSTWRSFRARVPDAREAQRLADLRVGHLFAHAPAELRDLGVELGDAAGGGELVPFEGLRQVDIDVVEAVFIDDAEGEQGACMTEPRRSGECRVHFAGVA